VSSAHLSIASVGLVTSVGFTAAASCAAIRAKVSNPTQTHFEGNGRHPIIGHQVFLERQWTGRLKLAKMAALAIRDCLADIPRREWPKFPTFLCVAERDRPGRVVGLDDELFHEIEAELDINFSDQSIVIPHGRTSFGIALSRARRLLEGKSTSAVLIAAADSLLAWPTLKAYLPTDRLLTTENSNGFMPGEGATAILVDCNADEERLRVIGLGYGAEGAAINTERPLRGDGLTAAIKAALKDAHCELHDLDFRITDLSGEQYYFKEAALALGRIIRVHKDEFDVWHPAECIGEVGAVAGFAALAVAHSACGKGYAPGPGILCHGANDGGERVAAVLHYGSG
jgi:3-oxoacyl-[acyl-carrier-protein] synthase I